MFLHLSDWLLPWGEMHPFGLHLPGLFPRYAGMVRDSDGQVFEICTDSLIVVGRLCSTCTSVTIASQYFNTMPPPAVPPQQGER